MRYFDIFNSMRPRKNGCYFLDDIFKCIYRKENAWISINISKLFQRVHLTILSAPSHYLNKWWLNYGHIYVSLSLNELTSGISYLICSVYYASRALALLSINHDDVIKWKHCPRYWPFVRGIHRSPVNSPHKGQWRWALMFSLICARINGWVNNGEVGDSRRHRAHCNVIVMYHGLRGLGVDHVSFPNMVQNRNPKDWVAFYGWLGLTLHW